MDTKSESSENGVSITFAGYHKTDSMTKYRYHNQPTDRPAD